MVAPLTSGRRAVLVMGLPFALASIGYGALALVNVMGLSSYVDTQILTPRAHVITLTSPNGSVQLQPSPDDLVHVRAEGHYTLQRPRLRTASTETGVSVSGTGCSPVGVIVCTQNLTVLVPAAFEVAASSSAGDVEVSGLTGSLSLHSSAGDVSGTALSGAAVSASSSAGDVTLAFTAVPDVVDATSSAGDVSVAVPGSAAYSVKAGGSAGDAEVAVLRDDSSSHVINATSSAGDVTVRPN